MKAKELEFVKKLANDRIQEKINNYKNNLIMLNYMIKNKIEKIKEITTKELEYKLEKDKKYIMIALEINENEFKKIIRGI